MAISFQKSSQMALTLIVLAFAMICMWIVYQMYFAQAWTRDAQVNAIVIKVAPRVTGPIIGMQVVDNQLVSKGERLFTVDPAPYQVALDQAQANLDEALAKKEGSTAEESAKVALEHAKLELAYTNIVAPVDGYVTNLTLSVGTFVNEDAPVLAIIDKNSFWITGFFKETQLRKIKAGDKAIVTLMGDKKHPLKAVVSSIGWGINRTDTMTTEDLLPAVTPTFDWVRLAQRIPVHLQLESKPKDLPLVMGMTASVTILQN